MNYTNSDHFVVDAGTGFNRHEDNAAVTTAVTEKDMNMLIWSLVELAKLGGQTLQTFDETVPATYKVLLKAMKAAFGGNVTTVNFGNSPFALGIDHAGVVIMDATAGNIVANLPLANVLTAPVKYRFVRADATANTATGNRSGADTLPGVGTSFTLSGLGDYRALESDTTSRWLTTAVPGGSVYTQLSSGSQSVAANALTVTVDPGNWDFRNPTLGSPVPVKGTLAAAASIVAPNGASFGAPSGVQSAIGVLLILPTGLPPEVALINFAGGVNLDQGGLISTTAISAAATAAGVAYSTTARANVPYRLERVILSTQPTAGQWSSGAFENIPVGGAAFNAMSSLGYGSVNTNPSRSFGTTYTAGRRPRLVSASGTGNSAGIQVLLQATVTSPAGAVMTGSASVYSNSAGYGSNLTFLVPPFHQYVVNASGGSISMTNWTEA